MGSHLSPIPGDGNGFAESMAAMSGVLLNDETLAAILQLMTAHSVSTVEGVDGASVSLLRGMEVETDSATSEEIGNLDRVQYEGGKGPCLAAMELGAQMNVALEDEDSRWPEFAAAARARGFVGVLSTSLAVRERHMGSLNLYSRSRGGFGPASETLAQNLADQASVVLSNAMAFAAVESVNTQFREALASRDVIGQAKGILMARHGCTGDEALDRLRQDSTESNRKLRDIAQEMTEAP